MKKQALICIFACAWSGIAMAGDVAISTQANWWSQGAADREMQEVADAVTGTSVELFPPSDQVALASWVQSHTGNGRVDLLILCGQSPDTLYPLGNTKPDGSIMEEFLDDGNCIINTGDWIFYYNSSGNNGTAGLQNIMDIPGVTQSDTNTHTMIVTAEGHTLTPSLQDFLTDRAFSLETLAGDWYTELALAQNADGTQADPVIVCNSVTGGRVGIFFQTQNQDDDPRGEVISEWINNWLLPMLAKMTEPTPADEAVDVPRDIVLSWTAGEGAVTHDVYFGTTFDDVANATRSNPLGVLISQGQTGATCELPTVLGWGQTYYWRVDEIGAAPGNAVSKGQVLSFTVEPFGYPVENIVVTTNMINVDDTQGPDNIVNGSGLNENDEHSTDTTAMWLATPGGESPMYIQFEFERVYKMYAMNVWNHNFIFEMALGLGIKDVTVECSTDGVEWSVFGDVVLARATGLPTYTANTTVALEGTPAKYIRLVINSNYGGSNQFGLSEVRFLRTPVEAREPNPADGATDVAVDTVLSWRSGREAVSHEVYLGADSETLAMLGTTTTPSYNTALNLETTYAWRVDEVNDAEVPSIWSSKVWTFTTQESLLLEDFEDYNDDIDAGTTIWQTWIDSLDNPNAGGSVVGYDQSPFTEQTTVYTGGNSMPLRYDNSSAGFSETTRTFSPAQKWNQYGITTLTLWVKGGADLSANETLYVKVNGTKVVYDGALTAPIWQPFNVDLTSMNVSNVSTLTIGVQGSGQGIVFVDTIALRAAPITLVDKTMVGYWKLDETSGMIAADSSGYGHDGTLVGMAETQWTTGINGGALEFAGTSTNPQWVDMGAAPNLELAGSVTMSAWVKMNEGNSGVYMGIGGRLNTSPYVGFALVRHSSNVFRLWANSASGELAGYEASSDATYTDTEWHHLVGVVDDGTSMLYVDGVKQAQEGDVDLQVSPGIFCLGKQYNVGTNHRYWLGLMDDVKVFYRALSADEVAGL